MAKFPSIGSYLPHNLLRVKIPPQQILHFKGDKMSEQRSEEFWTEIGVLVANGGKLNRSDLLAIYTRMDLGSIHPEYLPNESTIDGITFEQRTAIFNLAEKLWGLGAGDWLNMESQWLKESRAKSGSTETKGKDKISDVISPAILLNLVATARLVRETKDIPEVIDEAIIAINNTLNQVCSKGRTRMTIVDGRSVYSRLKDAGLVAGGIGGGRYLPYPKISLPVLLLMLDRKKINPVAYHV